MVRFESEIWAQRVVVVLYTDFAIFSTITDRRAFDPDSIVKRSEQCTSNPP